MNFVDCTGLRFGRLIIIERLSNKGSCVRWRCKCDCGGERITITARLRNGQCTSCGCRVKESTSKSFTKHGKSGTVEYRLLKHARKRAKDQQKDFNLELSDIIIPDFCPILNIPLTKYEKLSNNTPSLDKVNPSMGYVKGNVKVISMRANRLKQDSTIEELEKIIDYMKENGLY